MTTPINEHNMLTLDFWRDTVTYEGKTVPTGTLGCETLNIPTIKARNSSGRSQKEKSSPAAGNQFRRIFSQPPAGRRVRMKCGIRRRRQNI